MDGHSIEHMNAKKLRSLNVTYAQKHVKENLI